MSSSSEDEQPVVVESLATTRSRRVNAGARMSQMLEAEEDKFYTSLYGGFAEDEEDKDYQIAEDKTVNVAEDEEVDSDFSIDETDEPKEVDEDEDGAPRRKGRLVTKAYKEPKRNVAIDQAQKEEEISKATAEPEPIVVSSATEIAGASPERVSPKAKSPAKQSAASSPPKTPAAVKTASPSRQYIHRSFRESTKKKTEQTLQRFQQEKRKKKHRSHRDSNTNYQLTQEELMREAKKTEEENLKSLEFHQKLELERLKKTKIIKKAVKGSFIRYLSMSMPLLDAQRDDSGNSDIERYTRNFITFSDEETFSKFY